MPKPASKSKEHEFGKPIKSFQHGDLYVEKNDCVLLQPDEPSKDPFIGKVLEIRQSKDRPDDIRLKLVWFYRPEEAWLGRKPFHGEKEVFASDHIDWEHKNTVIGKCRVLDLAKYQKLETVDDHDFFTRFTYKPSRKEYEPDKVPVFCTCEMPYNPDKFMVECDFCHDWFHPECLELLEEERQQLRDGHVTHFTCMECQRTQDGPANKRFRVEDSPASYRRPGASERLQQKTR